MNKVKLQGHLIIAFVNILFALNMIISKSLLPRHISPEGLTLSRMVFACVAFWITSLFVKKEKVEKKDLFLLFICGMCGIAINQGAFIIGLNSTSPVDASILVTSTPMFVMILAFFLLKEPITFKKAGGVVTGALGAILLILSSQQGGQSSSSTFGDFMVLVSGFSYSIYLVIVKPITQKYSAVTVMKWMFLFSTIVLLPFNYKAVISAPVFQAPFHTDALLRIFYVLFCATFLTYMLIPMALKRIRPTTVSMYNYLQPVVASLVASFIGQDVLTWQKIGSAMLIFLGVYLVTVSKSRQEMIREEASEEKVKNEE